MFSIGEQVEAVWLEDGMYYLAEVVDGPYGGPGECMYDVVFVEYGNKQLKTTEECLRPASNVEPTPQQQQRVPAVVKKEDNSKPKIRGLRSPRRTPVNSKGGTTEGEGFLKIRHDRAFKWGKKKFACIRDNTLAYYNSKALSSKRKQPLGAMDLTKLDQFVLTCEDAQPTFELHSEGECWYLCCIKGKDLAYWSELLVPFVRATPAALPVGGGANAPPVPPSRQPEKRDHANLTVPPPLPLSEPPAVKPSTLPPLSQQALEDLLDESDTADTGEETEEEEFIRIPARKNFPRPVSSMDPTFDSALESALESFLDVSMNEIDPETTETRETTLDAEMLSTSLDAAVVAGYEEEQEEGDGQQKPPARPLLSRFSVAPPDVEAPAPPPRRPKKKNSTPSTAAARVPRGAPPTQRLNEADQNLARDSLAPPDMEAPLPPPRKK